MKINETRMIKLRYLIAHKLPLLYSKLYYLMVENKILCIYRNSYIGKILKNPKHNSF